MNLSKYSSGNFDRGAGRWKEAIWIATKCLFFLTPWPIPSRIRCQMLRAFGATIGHRVVIRSRVNIWFPWRLKIEDDVWLGEEVFILNLAQVTIESSSCISQRAFLCTGSHNHRREDFELVTRPIVIHRSSWVAAQAFVGPGVSVGPDSIVSAGSIVFRDVPPSTVVQGNPAEPIKKVDPPIATEASNSAVTMATKTAPT